MEEKKSNGTKGAAKWKEVAIGGISGIALGTSRNFICKLNSRLKLLQKMLILKMQIQKLNLLIQLHKWLLMLQTLCLFLTHLMLHVK